MTDRSAPSPTCAAADAQWYETVDEVPPEEWRSLVAHPDGRRFDPRLLRAVDRSVAPSRIVIARAGGRAVAVAVVTLENLDLLALSGYANTRPVATLRRRFPRLLRLRAVVVGVPISIGAPAVVFAPDGDNAGAFRTIDEAVTRVGAEAGCSVVVYKELQSADPLESDLRRHGHALVPSLPMYSLRLHGSSFDDYLGAMRSSYRYDIRRSRRKLAESPVRTATLRGAASIRGAYDVGLQRLFEHVVDRAKVRYEQLSREFFVAMAEEFADDLSLTVFSLDGVPVAFNLAVQLDDLYHLLYCGLDYELNQRYDLYFNLFFHEIENAYARGCEEIAFGQTSDAFKRRIGAQPTELLIGVRARRGALQRAIGVAAPLLFPHQAHGDTARVWREGSGW